MAGYVDLPSVRTWYAERGEGESLVMLHGGVVDARFFDQNIEPLAEKFHVYTPDFRGHGHSPDIEGPFSYDAFARDSIEFLDAVLAGPTDLLGHSIGAGVALMVALRRPDLVRRLVLISGAFHRDGLITGDDIDVNQVVNAFGSAYGEVSPDGEDHYPVVVRKVTEMDRREPDMSASDVNGVRSRTLLVTSDDDIVTLEHTIALYRAIPDCELAIVPGTSHFLIQEKPDLSTGSSSNS